MRGYCVHCKRVRQLAYQNRHGLSLCPECLNKQLEPLALRQRGEARPWPRMIRTLEGNPIWLTGDIEPGTPLTIDGRRYVVAIPEGGKPCKANC